MPAVTNSLSLPSAYNLQVHSSTFGWVWPTAAASQAAGRGDQTASEAAAGLLLQEPPPHPISAIRAQLLCTPCVLHHSLYFTAIVNIHIHVRRGKCVCVCECILCCCPLLSSVV